MKTILIAEPRHVGLQAMNIPQRQPGEALLKLLVGGICGSDLNIYRGHNAYVSYPRIPGHEFSAEIIEIDTNPQGLTPGMVVTCNPYFNCGGCYPCRRGLVNCCETNQTMGVQCEGAFREYLTMPLTRIYDGQGLDPVSLALIEPFCISSHGTERAAVKAGERVLIIGAGTIGMLAAMSAKSRGAHVTLTDIAQTKLDIAKGWVADEVFLNTSPAVFDREVARLTHQEGYDVTIEAVGLPLTFQQSIDAAAFGGRVVLVGVSKENLDFNFTLIQKKELNVYGSRNAYERDFRDTIALVKKGGLDLSRIVTHTYKLAEAPQAFADFDANAAHMLKVMIDFR